MARPWSINGRFLTQSVTGVQRYATEILLALDRLAGSGHPLASDLDLELVVPEGTEKVPPLTAIRTRRSGRVGGHIWEQTILPLSVRGGLLSFCNTGPLSVFKQIVCVHDLNTRLIPESFSPQFRALYRVLVPALGRTAEHITTVSHFSRQQLDRFGVAPPSKTSVIGNGHEHVLRWRPEHSDKTRAAAGPDTIVVFGTGSPNKNVGLLIAMAPQLAQAGLRLAVAGATDRRVFSGTHERTPSDNVIYLGRVSDNELAALMQGSMCLAFPSLVEGFGLPPLEAMSIGCPVVVSDTTCLPEICGDAALYASPKAPDQWLQAFVRLHGDPVLRAELIARGLRRASLYSWRASAEAYLEAMARSDGVQPAVRKESLQPAA